MGSLAADEIRNSFLKLGQRYPHGRLEIYVFDPYSIALSKLGRGFETDLQDLIFLLQKGIINLAELTVYVEKAKNTAWDYDINPVELQSRLNEIRLIMD